MPLFRTKPIAPTASLTNDVSSSRPATGTSAANRSSGNHSFLLIVILAIVATALCYRAFHRRYDQELHQAVHQHLRRLFPEASIFVGYVTRDPSGAVIATDVCMADKRSRPKQQVFIAQRVVLRGNLDIADWVQGKIAVRQVDLYGAQFDVWPIAGEQWSVHCMVPQPTPEATPPKIAFHDAIVRLRHDAGENSPGIALHHISATIEPRAISAAASTGSAVGTLPLQGETLASHHMLLGRLTGSSTGTADKFTLTARFDPGSGALQAKGSFHGLRLSQTLRSNLPPRLAQHLSQLSGLECIASAAFEVQASPKAPFAFRLQGCLASGRLQDPRLPYPLENLHSDFSCENSRIQLRNTRAESGSAQLELNMDIQGFGVNSPMTIIADAHHLELDHRLYQSLPSNLQQQWEKLKLSGRVSGNVKLHFDGARWTPSLSVTCEEVAIQPWLFPYPLTDLKGHVTYQNSRISSQHLSGRAGGQEVAGSFSLQRSEAEWIGRLECQTSGPVAIDEQLIAALTPADRPTSSAETFVRSLHPTGSIQVTHAAFQRDSISDRWHRNIDAHVYGGRINFQGFRYPIYDIRGQIVSQDDQWWLHSFEGRNDSGRILCAGNWQCIPEGGPLPLDLRFDAFSVPTEEQLKMALPSEAQFAWDELRPSGSIDKVAVRLFRPDRHSPMQTVVRISEDSSSNKTTGRSLRLHPKTFPYLLNDVDCEIHYTPGHILIEEATGVNGTSRLSLKGICEPLPDGRWKAKVEWLPQTRLIVESELLRALPESIRDSLVKIDFRGPISVLGKSEVVFANQVETRLTTSWDCQLAVEDGQLADGKNIGALRGTVWMQGYSNGTQLNATGTLAMDALTVRGIPVTRLNGPFALLGSKLYFGSRISEALPGAGPQQAVDLTADALSGKLTLSGQGRLNDGKFFLKANLRDAKLSLLLKDLGVDSSTAEAVCEADLEFNGTPWNPQTYNGGGRIRLNDANLYQLPFMIRLMRVASVNATDDSAFQTADIRFDIAGDRIPLQVACDGEVLRLRGEGWTNLRRDLQLDLYSYVGRRVPIANVLSPMLAESRYATFMLIEVDGSLDNPIMQRRAFPQLEATFQQIFPELAEKRGPDAVLPWRR